MIRYFLLAVLIVMCFTQAGWGQKIEINEPPKVAALVSAWVNYNSTKATIAGWRVQVGSSTDRLKIEEDKRRFETLYPEITADWVQEKPYYKLRVGAFLKKWEAQALIKRLSEHYPGAYATKDTKISPKDFLMH